MKYLILIPLTFLCTLIFGALKIGKMAKDTYSNFGKEVYKCEMWLRYFLKLDPYKVKKEV